MIDGVPGLVGCSARKTKFYPLLHEQTGRSWMENKSLIVLLMAANGKSHSFVGIAMKQTSYSKFYIITKVVIRLVTITHARKSFYPPTSRQIALS